jgi:exonuclease III
MTSFKGGISVVVRLRCPTNPSTIVRLKHTSMSRDISPPPSKRRKTVQQATVPISTRTSPLNPPKALPKLDDNTIRIFSWNVNGIQPFLQKSITAFFQASKTRDPTTRIAENETPPASLRGFLQRHHWPAILFLQEVKIATKDLKTQDAVKTAVNSRLPSELGSGAGGPRYEAHFTLPNDPYNARGLRGSGKVYGVCSILRSDLRDKFGVSVRTVDWDNEGRISVVELKSDRAKLAVFNIYAVNGTDNPYRDPKAGLNRGTRHDRKLEVHRLLMQECVGLEQAGWEVLLAGDMNVAPDARDGHPKLRTFPQQHVVNRSDFHEKLLDGGKKTSHGLNGVDIWRGMHGEERKYTYFSRGREWGTSCDRVDYFIAGRRAWDKGYIKDCGILDSPEERGPSDHVPIWADIELTASDDRAQT